ncbi:MAG: DUF2203 domain-containing protein [Candidatus Korobacteraceae bacterium]|jgi:hypothetical protein
MRTFSLHEAQAMLPVLESLLRASIESKQKIEGIEAELQHVQERVFLDGGTLLNVKLWARRGAERDKALRKAKDAIAEINAIGVQVKDLEMGLLDFPCKVESGEIVLLCWKLGETAITHWHGLEEGYAGRKPIDERIQRAKPDQIN